MNKIIAVDFDGTLCENKWPEIGRPNGHLIRYLRELKLAGHKIILWTCRTGQPLDDAIEWCAKYGLIFDAINENVPEAIERFGGDCRKIFADVYYDDKAVTVDMF
jgi:hydroxymethylpyrimidine pyrophosphatase-like HAD family hydrolase